jgi:hypothetical protein
MNVEYPDKNSIAYKQYLEMIAQKVSDIMSWLSDHQIDYVWNYWIGNHLYRIYIPSKDLLLDFECYPVNNINYNYIRVNHNTDVIKLLERLFPKTIVDTQELTVWKLNQGATNKFLRSNGSSPVYYKNVLRLALVRDTTIYQCIIVKDHKIIVNITQQNCSVPYGTYILLRYLTEMFGEEEIIINDNLDNSYNTMLYQLLNLPVTAKTPKQKIWWSSGETKWRIKPMDKNKYVPLYLTEHITYCYSAKS